MLINSFFKIVEIIKPAEDAGNKLSAVIRFIPTHEIYEGHFPGNPVVPGACLVQIIKEILENSTGKNYVLNSSSNIKFLKMIKPDIFALINFEYKIISQENDILSVECVVSDSTQVFCKFKGTYIITL